MFGGGYAGVVMEPKLGSRFIANVLEADALAFRDVLSHLLDPKRPVTDGINGSGLHAARTGRPWSASRWPSSMDGGFVAGPAG
jgi:hypothetical protein